MAAKKIIVTGGLGFIGSNYLNKMAPLYPDDIFINVDCETKVADKKNVSVGKAKNYIYEKIDIRDLAALEKAFKKHRPTGIINFAAETHVDVSIENPSIFVETNVIGTHNLLKLAKKYGIDRFHQISTDEVYGALSPNDEPFTTSSPLAPNSPYSASKAAADLLVRSYAKTFGLNAVITRCSNNYGPNQDLTKLIPKALSLLIQGKKVPVYGNGKNVRDWIYVEDHVDAIGLVFRKGKAGEVYNIGGDSELSNNDIVRRLSEMAGHKESMIEYVKDRPGHDFRYAIDGTEIKRSLGWGPKTSLEDGLKATFEHYRNKLAS